MLCFTLFENRENVQRKTHGRAEMPGVGAENQEEAGISGWRSGAWISAGLADEKCGLIADMPRLETSG